MILKIIAIGKEENGIKYTPTGIGNSIFNGYSIINSQTGKSNSLESDRIRIIDLKLEKDFNLFSKKITTYLLVKNLLDEEIITGVYTGTGSPTNTGYLETAEGQARSNHATIGADFNSRYKFAQANPLNFGPPRQIFFGIKTSF